MIGRAYEPRPNAAVQVGGVVFTVIQAGLQLVLPVVLLLSLGLAAFLYGDRPASWFGSAEAQWLSQGDLILPLTFFAIVLTNRRYGAAYALGQVLIAWAAGGLALWLGWADVPLLLGRPLPDMQVLTGFGAALFVAQLFSVMVFDRTRGPRWWMAPFLALFWGGIVYAAIAFPLTYMGTSVDWLHRLAIYAGIMTASAVVLLVPYWLLRRLVPPQSGFGGY